MINLWSMDIQIKSYMTLKAGENYVVFLNRLDSEPAYMHIYIQLVNK